jgi:uncharacterized membrane protein required for colicin V production
MQIDIGILVIIVLFAILGFKNGLIYSLSQTLGWAISFVASFFLYHKLSDFFMTETQFYDKFYVRIAAVCQQFIAKLTGGVAGSVPGKFGETLDALGDRIAAEAAEKIAAASFSVLIFTLIVIAVKVVLFILLRLLSKKHRAGYVGGFDAAFGLLVGVVQGVVVVFVLLLVIMPVSFLIGPGVYAAVQHMMDQSFVAKMLYLNNPLLLFIDGYMPSVLSPDNWMPARSDYEFTFKDLNTIR